MAGGLHKPLLVMGEIDADAPLAAIYRTRFGRTLPPRFEGESAQSTPLSAVDEGDIMEEAAIDGMTAPPDPSELPDEVPSAVYEDEDQDDTPLSEAIGGSTVDVLSAEVEVERQIVDQLADVIPEGLDPVWSAKAIRAVSELRRPYVHKGVTGSWYDQVFRRDYFRARPAHIGSSAKAEAGFVRHVLGLKDGHKVLDCACGYGRLGILLSEAGCSVVALDRSEDMLEMARALCQGRGIDMQLVHGDMRSIAEENEYDGILSTNTSFGYFDDVQNLAVLSRLAKALKPGARLLIDVLNRDQVIQDLPSRTWWEGEGCLIQEDAEFDVITSRLTVKRLLVSADGGQREALISIRLYSAHELVEMMKLVDLEVVDVSGSPQTVGAFFPSQNYRLMVTGQKHTSR